jgi:hypothetical protein
LAHSSPPLLSPYPRGEEEKRKRKRRRGEEEKRRRGEEEKRRRGEEEKVLYLLLFVCGVYLLSICA